MRHTDIFEPMVQVYNLWQEENAIAEKHRHLGADELLYEMAQDLTSEQRKWLSVYCDLWILTFNE